MITKDFIKMCEKAGEIQKGWKLKFGDYVKEKKYGDLMIIAQIVESHDIRCISYRYRKTGYKSERYLKNNFIYLPTQEQLQEMILKPKNTLCPDIFTMLRLLNVFAVVNKYDEMNELWLAFVMHGKYNKIWTGEDWELDN